MAGSDSAGIFHRTQDLKTDCPAALPAQWKTVSLKQSRFMHQAMRIVRHAVNAAFWDQISGPMLLFRTLFASQRSVPKGDKPY